MDFFYCNVRFSRKTKILGLCINDDKNLVKWLNHIPISKIVIYYSSLSLRTVPLKTLEKGCPCHLKREGSWNISFFVGVVHWWWTGNGGINSRDGPIPVSLIFKLSVRCAQKIMNCPLFSKVQGWLPYDAYFTKVPWVLMFENRVL